MTEEELLDRKVEIETTVTCPHKLDCTKCGEKCKELIEYERICKELVRRRTNKRWVIADTHFGHKNIIEYADRPFKDLDEMAKELIKRWNNKVSKDDIVYMLGDFTLTRNKEYIADMVSKLNGKKVLVMGNHDTRKPKDYIECGFEVAIRKPILVEHDVILMHEPPYKDQIVPGMKYIFGHVHDTLCEADEESNCFCVSVERINYTPVDLDVVIEMINNRLQNK